MLVFVLLLCTYSLASGQQFLAVQNGQLRLNGDKVFMSGMNIAWHHFGMDFGNGRYECCTGTQLEDYIRAIKAEGGNSLRIWLHCAGDFTPQFDANGFVTGPDSSGSMIADLSRFLDVAYTNDVLVFLVLWNGATAPSQNYLDLMWDNAKLQSYIDNALVPMVTALKDKVALGGWEIMNEPEGLVFAGQQNANPCYDTQPLAGTGAGWVNTFIPMENLLRFINRQNGAIRRADTKAVITLGSWSERAQTDQLGWRNYYTDTCLRSAGGDNEGILDVQQMHTYAWQGSYTPSSPLVVSNSAYGLTKPNVIGEFSAVGGDGRDITVLIDHAYNQGYAGAWTWQANAGGEGSDDFATQARAMNHLRNRNDQNLGGRVNIDLL